MVGSKTMRKAFLEAKTVMFLTYEPFSPLLFQVAKALERMNVNSVFVTFTLSENILLKKNRVVCYPKNVFEVKKYTIRDDLFSSSEMEEIVSFSSKKLRCKKPMLIERLQRISSFFYDLVEKIKPSAIIVWNGEDFISKAAIAIAKRESIKCIFGENGYFQNTLQFDFEGINIKSSIANLSFDKIYELSQKKVLPSSKKSVLDFSLQSFHQLNMVNKAYCFLMRKLNVHYYSYFPELIGNTHIKEWFLEKARVFIKFDTIDLPEKFVFIPLQVHDDTQVLCNSRLFNKMEPFVQVCYETMRRVYGKDYKLVVKEHPKDLGRISYKKFRKKYNDIIWLRKYNLDLLLDKASVVCVLNSSVGLQALQKRKPVILFGEAFYDFKEILFKVDDLTSVDKIFTQAKEGLDELQKNNIDRYLNFLKDSYFIRGSWKEFDVSSVVTVANYFYDFLDAPILQK